MLDHQYHNVNNDKTRITLHIYFTHTIIFIIIIIIIFIIIYNDTQNLQHILHNQSQCQTNN